jgi:hypothetical protein
MLSLSPLGCGGDDWPEAAGQAVVIKDGERLVLDTGNNGQTMISTRSPDWATYCTRKDGALEMHVMKALKYDKGFHQIWLYAEVDANEDGKINVSTAIADDLYMAGVCATTYRTTQEEPYEGIISAASCDLESPYSSDHARLEAASFRLKNCYP